MSSDASCEESSVHEGAGYDEAFGSGDESEDFSPSSKRETSAQRTSEGPGDNRPFILPQDWAINKFLPRMSDKVFRELRIRYQIPDHIPIRLPRENESCYSRRTADVGMYDAMFAAGLRLPLTALHR